MVDLGLSLCIALACIQLQELHDHVGQIFPAHDCLPGFSVSLVIAASLHLFLNEYM
jgi:hypothetical protein